MGVCMYACTLYVGAIDCPWPVTLRLTAVDTATDTSAIPASNVTTDATTDYPYFV